VSDTSKRESMETKRAAAPKPKSLPDEMPTLGFNPHAGTAPEGLKEIARENSAALEELRATKTTPY